MLEKKDTQNVTAKDSRWLWYALGSALFASLTAILGKVGITNVESNLGTALRTGVVLIMSWMMVLVTGKGKELRHIEKRSWGSSACPALPPGQAGCATIKPCRTGLPAWWRPLIS